MSKEKKTSHFVSYYMYFKIYNIFIVRIFKIVQKTQQ